VDGLAVGERVAVIPVIWGALLWRGCPRAGQDARQNTSQSELARRAATWMAFGTAWAGLIDIARLSTGRTVLITAASSSAGLAAIQTARRSARTRLH